LLLGAWTALTVWSACLWVVAGGGLGWSWAQMVESASAELIAVAAALVIPNYFLDKALLVAMRARPSDALAVRMALAGRSSAEAAARARWQLRLLAVAAAMAAAGGVATSACGPLAAGAMRRLGGMFLWPDGLWLLGRLAVRVAMFGPMALGIAAVTLSGSLIRRGRRDDPYRHVTVDLLAAVAGGLAVAACLWWLGANLHAAGLVCAVALAAVSAGAVLHQGARGRTYHAPVPRTTAPPRRQRRWNLLGRWRAC